MKRFRLLSILLALVMALCLALSACGGGQGDSTENGSGSGSGSESDTPSEGETDGEEGGETTKSGSVLVAYFSAQNHTEAVAQYIAEATNADTFEITPVNPYSSDDLDWTDNNSRVSREHEDESLRVVELEKETPDGWDDYKTVFIGYPIWWGIAAWPVNGFVEANDFTGKTVIPFCTSSSSGLGQSAENLKEMANGGEWLEGRRFPSGASQDTVEEWVESLDINFGSSLDIRFPLTEEAPGANALNGGPQSASRITSVEGVPLVTLNNGVEMPRFGLGTQIQDLENSPDLGPLNRTSRTSVIAALQAGYRHLDDAHGYRNERGVAQGIEDSGVPREEIWLTDKLWPSEYANAEAAIDAMLDRLGVEYIDLLYLHHPAGPISTIESAWRAMEKAYREGKIRALGISNFDNRPQAYDAIMDEEIKPQVMQIECHPLAQRKETRELAARDNIQVECWYPLKHADPSLLGDTTLDDIAEAHGKSVVQVIVRWHIQEGFSVIPGSTNPEHIAENIDVFDFELTEDEMNRIRALDMGDSGRSFRMGYSDSLSFFGTDPPDWNGTF